jgi:hypothetical protein
LAVRAQAARLSAPEEERMGALLKEALLAGKVGWTRAATYLPKLPWIVGVRAVESTWPEMKVTARNGLLKALEEGITALLGLTGNGDYAGPIGLADLTQVLSRRYGLELQDQLGATLWQRLAAWAARDAQAVLTQAELVALWGIKQPSVSQTLQQLIGAGAVDVLPRKGGEPLQYLLAGATRLALG